jgi:hypothetical protein
VLLRLQSARRLLQHLPNRAIKTRTRVIFISLSLCESVRLQKKAVSAVLSRRREKQNGSSLFIRLRFHLAHSRSTSTQCVFMHKQKLRDTNYFASRRNFPSHFCASPRRRCDNTFQCALGRCTPFLCAGARLYVKGVQKIALLFMDLRPDLLPTVCGKSESGKCCQFPCFFCLPVCQFRRRKKQQISY